MGNAGLFKRLAALLKAQPPVEALGAALGVMNGYPSLANGGSFFAALPLATVEGRHFGINVGVIPSMGKVDGAVIIQFKLRLN